MSSTKKRVKARLVYCSEADIECAERNIAKIETAYYLFPADQYEAIVEQAAEAIANRNGYTILKPEAPGISYRDDARAALRSVGILPLKPKK